MNKIVKGQAWISNDALIQEQITFTPGKQPTTTVVKLIDNIWDDLTSDKGTYKSNDKKTYFYWEVEQSDISGDGEIKVMIECPKPKEGLFNPPYDETPKGDWAKYWLEKFKTTYNNFQQRSTIQPKEVVFPGTEYINQQGETVKVEERRVPRDNFGDITNLLSMF